MRWQLVCQNCGDLIDSAVPNRKWCDACYIIRRRKQAAERNKATYVPVERVDLVCETCGQVWHSRSNRGRWCPPCREERAKEQRRVFMSRPEERAKRTPEVMRPYQRAYTLRQHGLTPEDYADLFDAQGGKCAICKKVPAKSLCVDHCHATGKVRGLLCSPCNRAIGVLGDTSISLQDALDYLREFEEWGMRRDGTNR